MAAAAQQPVSAQVVGRAFVSQYYHVLHVSPELLHMFYKDISKVGRPEEDGSISITTTTKAINEKLLGLKYGDLSVVIKSIDSQESFNGGVIVLVSGYMTGKDKRSRNFAHSFFLAPQHKGYFVLNDMFRYVEAVPATAPENHENNTPPAENGDVPIVEEEAPLAEVVDQLEDDTWMIVESSAKIEGIEAQST
ncbi:nuclear transport factor 2-like [Salvia miltiorrhiza]|uniref:nuclear transport factor 2-like n=1 Tax=Salvia miltiorrhiza TaxID=226208 RepID=UPI0025ABB251|nr:nuclear transport factor 2-like [Salvia miltiorrhiza]